VVYCAVRDQRPDTDIGPAIVMITHPHGNLLALEPLRCELERLSRHSGDTPRPFNVVAVASGGDNRDVPLSVRR
jgi:hypothetical protein